MLEETSSLMAISKLEIDKVNAKNLDAVNIKAE